MNKIAIRTLNGSDLILACLACNRSTLHRPLFELKLLVLVFALEISEFGATARQAPYYC